MTPDPKQHISKELNIGRAGQHLALADLLIKDVQVFGTAEGMNYDIVADVKNRFIKLQVKTTSKKRLLAHHSKPIYFFHIRRAGKGGKRQYQRGEFDGFALVALDIRKVFYLPFDENVKTASICVRDKELNYKGSKKGLYYQDLTWDNFLSKLFP